MVVQRIFFRVKVGCTKELVQMILDEWKRIGFSGTYRVSTPEFGPQDQVCWEAEFAGLAEVERFWDEWWAEPTTPAFMKRWNELTESGGTNEIWRLQE